MNIRLIKELPISDELIRSWSDFVFNHKAGNIFQHIDFFRLCHKTPGYKPVTLLALDEKDNVRGVMQGIIMRERSPLISYLSSRAIAWGGPLASDRETYSLLIKEYENALGKHVIYSQIRPIGKDENAEVLIENGFDSEPHLDIFNDLTIGREEMFSRLQNERRRKIRRAKEKGVIVRQAQNDIEIETAASIIINLYKSIGLPSPPVELILGAKAVMGESVKIFVAVCDGRIVGSRLMLCYRDMVYEWYAASDPVYQNRHVNDLMPWEIMLWASENGFRIFDFGGAGDPREEYGVRDFKIRYGGTVEEVSRFTHVHRPLLMFIGEKGIGFYGLIKKFLR